MFKTVRQVFLDMDGTIYQGSELFPTTGPFLEYLKRHGIGYMFLSNNSSYSTVEYINRLAGFGIQARPEEFYISTDYTIDYLRALPQPPRRLYFLGMPSVWESFAAAGFQFDDREPERVVVGFDRTVTYEKLCRAAWHLHRGIPGIATHPDVFCPTDEATWLPDCGSLTAALSAATGARFTVLGKPDPGMLAAAARRKNCTPRQTLMVGDRLETDIRLGLNAGALTAWIENDTAELRKPSGITPDYTVKNLGILQQLMEKELGK